MSENSNHHLNPSRRDFLKGTGAVLGGLTIAGMFSGVTGCSSENQRATTSVNTDGAYPVIVHESDVVVVGGGLAACTAARRVLNSGKTLAIIDKGRFGHSGASGENWGSCTVSPEFADDGGEAAAANIIREFWGLADQDWVYAIIEGAREGHPAIAAEVMGTNQQRNTDGSVYRLIGSEHPTTMTYGQRVRRVAQHLHRIGADIYERTMMIGILKSPDGHAAGVTALDLTNGQAHVFRAKEVIVATGSFSWSLGRTVKGPDDTGDGHAAFAKAGLGLANMEMTTFDYTTIAPYATVDKRGLESASIFTLNSDVWDRAVNSKGEVYNTKCFTSDAHKENPEGGFVRFILGTIKQVYRGETIFMDTRNILDHLDYPYDMLQAYVVDAQYGLGYTYKDLEETGQCAVNTTGAPKQSATMETEIPGLYSAVQALTYNGQIQAFGQGWVAGGAAAEAAGSIDLPELDWGEVDETFKAVYGHLEKEESSGGKRAIQVFEDARTATREAALYPRTEEKLDAGLAEYQRIREEDIPKMYCASKSRILNPDWRAALELDSVLMCSEAVALASKERKETRPWFYRADYPALDNDNFMKNIYCNYKGDGAWELTFGEINDTHISKAELIGTLEQVDLNVPED